MSPLHWLGIDQPNWCIISDTPRLLNEIWPQECALVNLFIPQQKLKSKTRTGAKVTKTYDEATTPLRRLLRDHPQVLTDTDRARLTDQLSSLDVHTTRQHVLALQATLRELATRRQQRITRRAKTHHVYSSRTKLGPPPNTRASTRESPTKAKRAS